jgi:hypothetical protein
VAVFDRLLTVWYYNVRNVLHKYANEDVSLGSWFIGLDVEHVDDRRMCCGTPPGMLFWFSSQYINEKPRDIIDLVHLFGSITYITWLLIYVQIVNGRLRRVIYVLLHLIGNAAGFAGLLRGWLKSTSVVARMKMHCGVQLSDTSQVTTYLLS